MYNGYSLSYTIPFAPDPTNPSVKAPDFSNAATSMWLQAQINLPGAMGGGAANTASFQVDTGSTGMVIPAYLVPGYTPTKTDKVNFSSSGNYALGSWAVMSVTFTGAAPVNGVLPTALLPVFIEAEAHNGSSTHNCSDASVALSSCIFQLGIGYGRPGGTDTVKPTPADNPLLHIAGMDGATPTMRAGYMITPNGIVAGLTGQNAGSGFSIVKLSPSTTDAGDWQTLPGQFYVNNQQVTANNTMLLDSGLSYLWSTFGGLVTPSHDACPASVKSKPSDSAFTCAPGNVAFTVVLGAAGNPNTVSYSYVEGSAGNSVVAPEFSRSNESAGEVNTGVHVFGGFNYFYDAVGGYVGFQPLPGMENSIIFQASLAVTGSVALSSNFSSDIAVYVAGDTALSTPDLALFSGNVSGGGALAIAGPGTVAFSGNVILPAGIQVAAGGLSLGGATTANISVSAPAMLANSGTLTGAVSNAGTFVNAGTLVGNLTSSGTVQNSSRIQGNVSNSGTFTSSGTIFGAVSNQSAFTNAGGTIQGSVLNSGTFANSGTIVGPVTNQSIFANTGGTIRGNVQNSGTLSNDGIIAGSVTNSGTLIGSGAISGNLVSTGQISPGHSIGIVSVGGNVLLANGSTYTAEIGPNGTSDVLGAGGTIVSNGSTLRVVPLAGFSPSLGSSYTLMVAGGGVSGSFVLDTVGFGSASSLYPFLLTDLATAGGGVNVTLVRSPVQFASLAQTPNQRAAAFAADRLPVSSPLAAALAGITQAQAPAAFGQLDGELYASAQSVLQQQSAYVRNAVTGRLAQAGVGIAAGGAPNAVAMPGVAGATLWGQAYAGWGSNDGNDNATATTSSLGGFIMGLDAQFADWRAGLAAGFSQSQYDLNGGNASGQSDNYDLAVYAGRSFGPVNLRFGAAYTWHDLSSARLVSFPGFAQAYSSGYGAGTAQVFGEVGYTIPVPGIGVPASLEPFAGLSYVALSTDSFSEGFGAASVTGTSSSFDTLATTLGLRGALTIPGPVVPVALTGMLGWQHSFGDTTPSSTLAFGGSAVPFTVSGTSLAEDAVVVSAGIAAQVSQNLTLGVSYSGQLASGVTENAVKGNFVWAF